jgi:hypothetical protein
MKPPFPTTEAELRAIDGDDWCVPAEYAPCLCAHGLFQHSRRQSRKAPCLSCPCPGWRGAAAEQLGAGL